MASRTLPGIGLNGDWDLGEDGWKDGMDSNLRVLSILSGQQVLEIVPAEPGAPAEGDIVILDETHATHPNEIAAYDEAAWVYIIPLEGMQLHNLDDGIRYTFDGAIWASAAGLVSANNLSDVANVATSRTNLDVYSKAQVDNLVTGLLDPKGGTDCSGNPNYPAALKGDSYYVTVAGKIGGAAGHVVGVGDVYWASADNAGGTEAAVGANWVHLVSQSVAAGGGMLAANNLSDVAAPATALENIGGMTKLWPITADATGARGLVLADAFTHIRQTNAGGCVVTVPLNATQAFPIGTKIRFTSAGAAASTLVATGGVTLNSRGGALTAAGQFAVYEIEKVATDVWDVLGDLV